MQQLLKVSFLIRNFDTDHVIDIGGLSTSGTVTADDLVSSNPQFWEEDDTDGNTHLCTTKIPGAPLTGTFNDGSPYTLTAKDFVLIDVIGGHPVAKPGGKGG